MLNEEQRKIAEENHGLIYSFMHYKHLNEDWYGLLAEAYCKAIETYNGDYGSLSNYVYTCMGNKMKTQFMLDSRPKSKLDESIAYFSLDKETKIGDEKCPMSDVTGENDETLNDIYLKELIVELRDILTNKELEIFDLLMNGFTKQEIWEKLNITRQWYHHCLRNIKKKYNNLKLREEIG